MLPQYNVAELIEGIKIRCTVPESQLTYTPRIFAKIATQTLFDQVIPFIMKSREEYFVEYIDVFTNSDGVIDIPDYCVGEKLRSVCYVSQASPLVMVNLPRINLDVVAGVGYNNYNTVSGFYVQDNSIILYPNKSVPPNTNIRLYFYKRRLNLIEPDLYGQIISFDSDAGSVVLDNVPDTWEVGTVINCVSSVQPFKTVNSSMTITAISSPTVFFDTVEDISVDDYLSEKGFSAIPQIPIEAMGYLEQLSAVRILQGQADKSGLEDAKAIANDLGVSLQVVISERVDGSTKKIMNPNGGLRLGAGLGRWSRGWTGAS